MFLSIVRSLFPSETKESEYDILQRKVVRKSNTKNLVKQVEGVDTAFCGREQFFEVYGSTLDHVTTTEEKLSPTQVKFVFDEEDDDWVDLGEENHTNRQPVPAHVRPSKSCLKTSSPTTVAELEK